ncbi:MAG TPA: hypothetical protein VJ745_01290, partial [Gaiellaceae bacterium]|nr:hypothetical protein [Gaiellaceae bacterium]
MSGHERPDSVQTVSVEPHRESTVALLLQELIEAAIPDFDGAGSVLTRRNRSLEVRVLQRMVLDVHGKVAL